MVHWNETVISYPYAITSVVYDPMALDINGDPAPYVNAQVSLQCLRDGTRIQLPITQASMALLPSPQQRALEAQAAKDAQEIKTLKAKLSVAEHSEKQWKYHSDKQASEIKRLEKLCYSYAEGKDDAERKWAETVGELDNTKNQLKEVRVANSQLLNANSCQASKIQALESQLNLLKHQYEGKCRAVRDLQTTGSAKERDEYSKAHATKSMASATEIVELQAKECQRLKTKFEQATKQAGEWKQTATTRAKEIDRLAELVLQRTKERDALQAEKGLCPCKPSKKLDPWGAPFWADYPLTYHSSHSSGFHYAGAASQAPKQTVAETPALNTRVTAVEARVTKLEEAEGFPMESYNIPDYKQAQLFMGGEWLKGVRGRQGTYYTEGMGKSLNWDKANQPTRWKPMPEKPNPDPMPGYYILDKSTQVEEGDEFEISPGIWMPSGNWSSCNKSQGKAHRYRRKIK